VALITPIPSYLLDFLIVSDIMMSVVVMMVAMYIIKPIDFNLFRTKLMLTLFRTEILAYIFRRMGRSER
jgi:flagellar biosynthesis protein FlhA